MPPNTTSTDTTGVTSGTSNQSANFTTAKDPYAPIIPYLNAGLNSASSNYAASGPQLTTTPWDPEATGTGDASLIPSGWAQTGLRQNVGFANALGLSSDDPANSAAGKPYFTALDRYQNPIDAQTQGLMGQYQDIYNKFGDIYGGYQTPMSNLQPLAANTSGALTEVQQRILDDNAARLGNRLASQYSGSGRYGSAGAGVGLARGIAETNNPLMAQFNQQNIGNALQANSLYGNMLGGQQGAAGGQGTATSGAGNLYNTAQARAQQYGQMLPGLAQLGMLPGQIGYSSGMTGLNFGNEMLGKSISSIAPLLPIFGNAGVTTGSSSSMGNTTGTSSQNAVTSQPTPWTTYAGLGISGAGLLCDRRLKMDIELDHHDVKSGLNMYTFHYKWQREDEPKVIGPMADEVMLKYPDAVVSIGGILHVRV